MRRPFLLAALLAFGAAAPAAAQAVPGISGTALGRVTLPISREILRQPQQAVGGIKCYPSCLLIS